MENDDVATEHETGFVRSFIIPARTDRYLSKLSSSKHRGAFLDRLNHQLLDDLDNRYVSSAPRPWPSEVDMCYVIADEREYDGQLMSATEAKKIVDAAYFGIVVSFVPGKLVCYKGESPSDITWLERT
jgi:hypothetical protein